MTRHELCINPTLLGALLLVQVLFDVLKTHGGSFADSFWARIFERVLLPIFDHVRAEVTDTTTFTSERRRAQEDAWLYETCTHCLQVGHGACHEAEQQLKLSLANSQFSAPGYAATIMLLLTVAIADHPIQQYVQLAGVGTAVHCGGGMYHADGLLAGADGTLLWFPVVTAPAPRAPPPDLPCSTWWTCLASSTTLWCRCCRGCCCYCAAS